MLLRSLARELTRIDLRSLVRSRAAPRASTARAWSRALQRGTKLLPLAVLITACCGESRPVAATTPDARIARDAHVEAGGLDAQTDKPRGRTLRGEASFYADFFNGRQTANGERYDPRKLTAAHRTLPLGTRVQITRLDTGRSVVVRVNDRGPFGKRRRIFDLSKAAARQLEMLHVGKAEVEAVILE